jgi:AcrR family transcriptional regulator
MDTDGIRVRSSRQGAAAALASAPVAKRLTRAESKSRTRAELLRAANRLFLRDGFVATSLGAIAEEADLTKGAVYSNFESKEELFLAMLQQADEGGRWYAPAEVDAAPGRAPRERAAAFGRSAAAVRPSRRHVALFLEMNAFALRSERTRRWVADYNRRFFDELGRKLRDALGAPLADPVELGLVAQSLWVGLMMHGAYDGELDEEIFERAYEALAAAAERSQPR